MRYDNPCWCVLVQQRMRDRFNSQKAMSILRVFNWFNMHGCHQEIQFCCFRSGGCGQLLLRNLLLRGITFLFSNVIHVLPEERTTRILWVCAKIISIFCGKQTKNHRKSSSLTKPRVFVIWQTCGPIRMRREGSELASAVELMKLAFLTKTIQLLSWSVVCFFPGF